MNADIIKGDSRKLAGYIQETWGDVSDQPTQELRGKMKQLMGSLQSQFGLAKEEAADAVNDALDHLGIDERV